MSVSGELLCSFELLKPLDSAALKNHIKKGRNKRNSMLNSPVSFGPLHVPLTSCQMIVAPLCHDAETHRAMHAPQLFQMLTSTLPIARSPICPKLLTFPFIAWLALLLVSSPHWYWHLYSRRSRVSNIVTPPAARKPF